VYKGEFENGMKHGKGKEINGNGKISYIGDFYEDGKTG